MIGTTLSLLAAGTAPDSLPVPSREAASAAAAEPGERRPTSRWFVRAGGLRAHYNSGARITMLGAEIPGSTVDVTDSTTLVIDLGYDVTDDVSIMLTGGIPPSADVTGEGTIAAFGKLGRVRFGPAILTAVYRLPQWHGLRPYVGAGGAHLFILNARDGALKDLKVRDGSGLVVQAGIEYRLDRRWELFADYKHIWLKVDATGSLAGEPVRARVTLDPDLISAGIKFHFD